jgi:hypothetical protein
VNYVSSPRALRHSLFYVFFIQVALCSATVQVLTVRSWRSSIEAGHYAHFLICSRPDPFGMPFCRLLRTSSQWTLADSDLANAGGSTSDDSNLPWRGWQSSGSKATTRHRPWKAKGPSTTDNYSSSQSTPIPPSTESRVDTFPTPYPAIPSVHLSSVAVPSPERIQAIGAEPHKLAGMGRSQGWPQIRRHESRSSCCWCVRSALTPFSSCVDPRLKMMYLLRHKLVLHR